MTFDPVVRSKPCGEAAALIDGTLGIELRRYVGTADHVSRDARGFQWLLEFTLRELSCAQYDVVDFDPGRILVLARVRTERCRLSTTPIP